MDVDLGLLTETDWRLLTWDTQSSPGPKLNMEFYNKTEMRNYLLCGPLLSFLPSLGREILV